MPDRPTLGAIVRAAGASLLSSPNTCSQHKRVLRAIASCRTPALGGHREQCDCCQAERVRWNSCRDRHCPQCQGRASHEWVEDRKAEVLPVGYFHVVFTLPHELNVVAMFAPEVFYDAILRAAGQALLDVGRTKLHALLGLIAVLHTWTQTMALHPHVHCIVPGGGFSLDRTRWIPARRKYLLPHKVLARRFRTLVTDALRQAWTQGKLPLPANVAYDTPSFDLLLVRACRRDWVVNSKAPFAGPAPLIAYLANYTHRIAITNHRLLAFDGERVTFRYRDSADGNTYKLMSLPVEEFLRRFLLHVVPKRFVRIRYYGFLANRNRAANVELARQLIPPPAPSTSPDQPATDASTPDPDRCPFCGVGHFVLVERLDPQPFDPFDSS